MDQAVSLFKALSDRNRLRVVTALLSHSELCACQISELMQVTGATASRHMSVLVGSGIVNSRKDGRWVYYSLAEDSKPIDGLIGWIRMYVKNDPETAVKISEGLCRN